MTATHGSDSTGASAAVLYLALELGWNSWKLAFTVGLGQRPRLRTIPARCPDALQVEIRAAKGRFRLPDDTPVRSCYEAGRDGFWLHRYLTSCGITNLVVDAASIEVNRRARRAKSDALDATKLVEMLIRYHDGQRKAWSVVRVPSPQDEDRRQLHRDQMALKDERTGHINRIKGLLASLGLSITVDDRLPTRLESLRQWDGTPVPAGMTARVLREFQRFQQVDRQVRDLDNQRARAVRKETTPASEQVRRLLALKGIGWNGAWLLVHEVFGWRGIGNRRELAALVGLVPSPYQSGESRREQGISKAGNKRVRWMMIELAWGWLRHQPQSELSQWYLRRFGQGNARARKVGIVALARKLLVALWRYLERGEAPAGAETVDLSEKLCGRARGRRRAS
jgi:transposase